MKFRMKDMSDSAAKAMLTDLVTSLSGIDPEDMTTTERVILKRASQNPPKFTGRGAEDRLVECR